MKIGSSLALICVGAILAFAVTANTSVFNLHTAGWLGRRLLVRRTYPGGRVEQVPVAPYVRNPSPSAIEQGVPTRPTLLDDEQDLIEDAEVPQYRPGTGRVVSEPPRATTEVIEDLYEQP